MAEVTDFTALISGSALSASPGKPAFVTYSFPTILPRYLNGFLPAAGLATFQSFSDAYKMVARAAIAKFGDVSGLTFFEVPSGMGEIQFIIGDTAALGSPGAAGFAFLPTSSAVGSDVFIDFRATSNDTNLYLLLHEIAHAIGFKHGFDGETTFAPTVDNATNSILWSGQGRGFTGNLGQFDVQAVQFLYGTSDKDGTQIENWSWDATTHTLNQTASSGVNNIRGVGANNNINSGSDADTIFIPGLSRNNIIIAGDGDNLITLAASSGITRIETGLGADRINIDQFQGSLSIKSGAGNDSINFDIANDTIINIDGGDGNDSLAIRLNDTTRSFISGLVLDGGLGSDTLFISYFGTQSLSFSIGASIASGSPTLGN